MTGNNIYSLLCFGRILKHFVLVLGLKHNGMSSIKITLSSQARSIIQYKNLKTEVMKCFANIYFNWQCLIKKIIPNYAEIKIPYTSPATKIIFIHCCTVLTVSLKHFILLLELKHNGMSLIKITLSFLGRTIFRNAPCIVFGRISQLFCFLFKFVSLLYLYWGTS